MTTMNTIHAVYDRLINAWNNRDAKGMAELFSPDGLIVGFDGSLMNGPAETETELSRIFAGHPTAKYVTKVKQIQSIDPDVSLLQAIAGMVPPGKNEIMPERNTIQTLVAVQYKGGLKISLFQNTPARFDGRPELVEAMTKELSQLL